MCQGAEASGATSVVASGSRHPFEPMKIHHIGRHRLVVGDSSDPAVRAAVMGDDRPDVAVIDPPFESRDEWTAHLMDPCIVFGQMRHMIQLHDWPFRFERVIVKARGHRSATVQIVHQHAFIAQIGSNRVLPADRRSWPSVIHQAPGNGDQEKPLSLLLDHLTAWVPPWEVVWDPYAGSGTTILAAQILGKRCIAAEIDPARADAIVRMMSQQLLPGIIERAP